MMKVLALAGVALVLITGFLLLTRRHKARPGELLTFRETPLTGLLGLALWTEAGILLYYAIARPERLLTSRNAEINTVIFLAASLLLGAVMVLYSTVKCTVVRDEGLTVYNLLGRAETLAWDEIDEVQRTAGKRIILKAGRKKVTVGGDREKFKTFVRIASEKIDRSVGSSVFSSLKAALRL